MGGGFAMGAERRCLAGRFGCMEAYRRGITCSRGVMNEPGRRHGACAAFEESTKHDRMQRLQPVLRKYTLHSLARQLVTEHQCRVPMNDEPGCHTLVEQIGRGRLIEQPKLDAIGHHRAELENSARLK